MNSSAMRLFAGSRWRHSMMVCRDYYVRMCWAGNQADSTRCSISWEEAVTAACRWRQKEWGDWRCLAVEKLSQVELCAEAWHTEPRSRRQTCLDEVDLDVDQPEENPQ